MLGRKDFDAFDPKGTDAPVLGLFAPQHMSYELDRDPSYEPSLLEMAKKAISYVEGSSEGFFIMIEGSRIDHSGHQNDARTHIGEIQSYYEVVSYVRKYVDNNPNTILVSVSDHDTGK